MRVLDFVRTIGNLSDSYLDIYVNEKLLCDGKKGLIFDELLYRELFLTGILYDGVHVYIEGKLSETPISEAVANGEFYADGKILLSGGALYLVQGFVVEKILDRTQIKEMFNL